MGVPKTEWVRKEAKLAGLKYYLPLHPCIRGHLSKRLTQYGQCLECSKMSSAQYRLQHPEKAKETNKQAKLNHPDRVKRNWQDWYSKNKEHVVEYQRKNVIATANRGKKWREDNPEREKERNRNYRKNNHAHLAAKQKARHTRKLHAMPKWADEIAINEIYLRAEILTKETGVKHHVDHIIPLQGKSVCGLHVPSNLQIITATENLQKHNKLLPEYQGG